ncbi:MAG: substrate-binding domain-containing protein, partial [Hyphomicrobiales bacterium]|nr:substrate-binding domain-containing protein [Hyphomicrobiales bacterium]
FRSSSVALMWLAVSDGVGVGFLPERIALSDRSLVEIIAPRDAWSDPTWTVTHVDLHRSHKVQAFLDVLRSKPSGAKSRAQKKATAKKKERQRPT